MAKTIDVSSDNTTWYTLPGSSGDLNFEGSSTDDTVFGNSFSSSQNTLVGWTVSANAYYKGFAGYVANFKKSGTSTPVVGSPMSVVTGKTYAIDDTTKEVWDYTATITVYDNGVDQTANVQSIDHLFGRITFAAAYTPTGPITIDVNYFPMSAVGTSRQFTLTMNAESVDTTDYATAQGNGGYMTYTHGLRTVGIDASGFYNASNAFKDLVTSRTAVIVEINPDGTDQSTARGWFTAISTGQSGDVGGNEDETITFELSVPDDASVVTPFKWLHASTTTLSSAVQTVLDSWQNETNCYVRYLSDGVAGYSGASVIADCSMSSSIDGMNEFSVSFQGSDAPTVV